MPKRILFTNITPLPASVTREVAVAMLHDHDEMIELNPLVIEHHPIKAPHDAPADEFLDCVWQELTDRVHYLPGGLVKGKVKYRACFHDLPMGLQTHIYAPMGLDIREKWSIGGTLPGEPPEPRELGVTTPSQGLYIREEGDMKCNAMLLSVVRKNLDTAHKVLVERILKKAERIEEYRETMSVNRQSTIAAAPSPRIQQGSHIANSRIHASPLLNQGPNRPMSMVGTQDAAYHAALNHPAYRYDEKQSYYNPPIAYQSPQYQPNAPPKQYLAELPGSEGQPESRPDFDRRFSSAVSELAGSEISERDAGVFEAPGSEPGSAPSNYKYNPRDYAPSSRHESTDSGWGPGARQSISSQSQGYQYQQPVRENQF